MGDATRRLYEAVDDFKIWLRRNPGTMDLQAFDNAVEKYFDLLFFDGCGPREESLASVWSGIRAECDCHAGNTDGTSEARSQRMGSPSSCTFS